MIGNPNIPLFISRLDIPVNHLNPNFQQGHPSAEVLMFPHCNPSTTYLKIPNLRDVKKAWM